MGIPSSHIQIAENNTEEEVKDFKSWKMERSHVKNSLLISHSSWNYGYIMARILGINLSKSYMNYG